MVTKPDADILVLLGQVEVPIEIERLDRSGTGPKIILQTSLRRQIIRGTFNLSYPDIPLPKKVVKIQDQIMPI